MSGKSPPFYWQLVVNRQHIGSVKEEGNIMAEPVKVQAISSPKTRTTFLTLPLELCQTILRHTLYLKPFKPRRRPADWAPGLLWHDRLKTNDIKIRE